MRASELWSWARNHRAPCVRFFTAEKAPWQFYRTQETSAEGALKVKLSVAALLHSIRLILDREKADPPVGSSFPAVDGENISVADARSRA